MAEAPVNVKLAILQDMKAAVQGVVGSEFAKIGYFDPATFAAKQFVFVQPPVDQFETFLDNDNSRRSMNVHVALVTRVDQLMKEEQYIQLESAWVPIGLALEALAINNCNGKAYTFIEAGQGITTYGVDDKNNFAAVVSCWEIKYERNLASVEQTHG